MLPVNLSNDHPSGRTKLSSAQRMRWFKKGLQSDRFDPNHTFQTDHV